MAQTNTVSVFVQMTTVTASGVEDRPEVYIRIKLAKLSADRAFTNRVPRSRCSDGKGIRGNGSVAFRFFDEEFFLKILLGQTD